MSEQKISRRRYLKYAGAGIVAIAVAGAGAYYATRPGPTTTPPTTTLARTTTVIPTSAKLFRIAAITSGGPTAEWNIVIKDGFDKAMAYYKSKGTNLDSTFDFNIGYGDIESELTAYASKQYDMIIACDVGYESAVAKIAKEFPNTQFFGVSFSGELGDNIGTWGWDVWEGYYPAGVVAGAMSKTGIIGMVEAFDFPQSAMGFNAFKAGAELINPEVKALYAFTNDWHDPAKGHQAAASLIAAHADVLTGMGNGFTDGTILEADKNKLMAIGYLVDAYDLAPKTVLTSVLWDAEPYYIQGIADAMKGEIGHKKYYLKIYPDKVCSLAPYHGNVPDDVQAKISPILDKIWSGELQPPEITTFPK